METQTITDKIANRIIPLITTICIEYALVMLSIIGDMISGIRKAKKRGEATRSKALRRTIDKAAGYYNVLLILTIVDAMQITAALFMRIVEGYEIPTIPAFTLIGSLGMAFIEVKSIFEKASEKEKESAADLLKTINEISQNPKIKELITEILKK